MEETYQKAFICDINFTEQYLKKLYHDVNFIGK